MLIARGAFAHNRYEHSSPTPCEDAAIQVCSERFAVAGTVDLKLVRVGDTLRVVESELHTPRGDYKREIAPELLSCIVDALQPAANTGPRLVVTPAPRGSKLWLLWAFGPGFDRRMTLRRPAFLDEKLNQIHAHFARGEIAEAEAALEQALNVDPVDDRVVWAQGLVACARHDKITLRSVLRRLDGEERLALRESCPTDWEATLQ
jgi:hypothetical protein